jgi:hypothetical protein
VSIINPKGCNINDFLLQTLIDLHGIPTDIKYDPYGKVWIVEYIKTDKTGVRASKHQQR